VVLGLPTPVICASHSLHSSQSLAGLSPLPNGANGAPELDGRLLTAVDYPLNGLLGDEGIAGKGPRPASRAATRGATFDTPGLWEPHLNLETRSACSRITRALSSASVPVGSPLYRMRGFDQKGIRTQPSQLCW
jgi:hypothetical protein